jgi:alginate O-acetyltransferase complex protein AlgI
LYELQTGGVDGEVNSVLFNSFAFISAFLPLSLIVFFTIARKSHGAAASFLVVASIFFYGWWNPKYVPLLLGSIAFNYVAGGLISAQADSSYRKRKLLLSFAVGANLVLLAYYKYANFFISNLNEFTHAGFPSPEIILPLGISFFTFTQIAFLVDTFRGEAKEYNPVHYTLFVNVFSAPHRRPHIASQRNDAAVRAAKDLQV